MRLLLMLDFTDWNLARLVYESSGIAAVVSTLDMSDRPSELSMHSSLSQQWDARLSEDAVCGSNNNTSTLLEANRYFDVCGWIVKPTGSDVKEKCFFAKSGRRMFQRTKHAMMPSRMTRWNIAVTIALLTACQTHTIDVIQSKHVSDDSFKHLSVT